MNKKIGIGIAAALAIIWMTQKPEPKKNNFLYLEVDEILPDRSPAGGDADTPTSAGGSGGSSGGSGNNAPMAGWINSL